MSQNHWALVVEDDAHQLMVITSILKEMNICCKRNTAGNDVVRQAQSMIPQPDFIILELDLMNSDSSAVFRSLQDCPFTAHIPIIAVGGESWFTRQDRIRAAGFAGFLNKPLPRSQFQFLIEQVLAGKNVWENHT